ncbi:MAG: solute carrier family 23 protein [Methylococcaceae bacterium]
MRKPAQILYWVNEKMPVQAALASAFQQMSFLSVFLVVSPILAKTLHLDHEQSLHLISATLLASGIGCALQATGIMGFGARLFCPLQITSSTFSMLFLAKTVGGFGSMFGAISLAGFSQMIFALLFQRFKAIFTVQVAGIAVMLIGLGVGFNGVKLALESTATGELSGQNGLLCLMSLGTMIIFNVWFSGYLRLISAFLGLLAGFLAGWKMGIIPDYHWTLLHDADWFYRPKLMSLGWRFDTEMIFPGIITGLFLALHGFGSIIAAQRFSDSDWKRPDMRSVRQGLLAEGMTNLMTSLMNGLPVTSSGGAVGLAAATGCVSRYLGYWLAGIMILIAFMPRAMVFFDILPAPVAGAALLFLASFTTLAGMQVITSRLLDNRKILTVGIALVMGFSYEPLKHIIQAAFPQIGQYLAFSGVSVGVLTAVISSALFRISDHTHDRRCFSAERSSLDGVIDFLETQGKIWGARSEVVHRAEYATGQAFEILTEHGLAISTDNTPATIELETLFNEHTFAVILYYPGPVLSLATHPPSHDEMLDSEEAVLLMAGYLLNRLADQVRIRSHGERSELRLIFND